MHGDAKNKPIFLHQNMYGVHDFRQRRFLPSIKLLMALHTAWRPCSVTTAAAELNLTQSTISRLILSLEEQLGKELFTRHRRRLIPDSAAFSYQRKSRNQ